MKEDLAWRLLGDLLDWTDAELAAERRQLRLMTAYKYDTYQGYQPGAHFYLALIGWLEQFPDEATRRTAYGLLRTRLIFISQREMHHLVSQLMPILKRELHHRLAKRKGIPAYETWLDAQMLEEIQIMQRRTLFVGLSDGARVDVFRRYNEGQISNEQVVASSEINKRKWDDLQKNLQEDIDKRWSGLVEPTFQSICLLDDFTGSGSSLIRLKEGEWKGKIQRFIAAIDDATEKLPITNPCVLHIHHHLASQKAIQQIESSLRDYLGGDLRFEICITYSYELPKSIVIDDTDLDTSLTAMIRLYYDENIEDEHTGKDIWYGYKECGLPLILEHNTPNNSVALLWASSPPNKESVHKMQPLFTRRKRHSSHG